MNQAENSQSNPQVIFSWRAPLRPYKKRSRLIIKFYLVLALLFSLIIVFFGDKILLIPIWAILFLFYVLTITPPPEVENKITHFGIETAGITMRWEVLSHFYFRQRFGFQVLTVVSHPPFFYHAFLVVPDLEIKKALISILSNHLIYQEKPKYSFVDRLVEWFSALIPEDDANLNLSQEDALAGREKPAAASL